MNNQTYNINGDTAAGAIAKSLKSRRLLLMTNVKGVLNKEKKHIEEISSSEILEMIKNGTITEGMIPKINTCLDAVNNGVTAVTPLLTASKQVLIFGIIPSVIVPFLIISKISEEEISSMCFFSLLRTPFTLVIKSNLLDFKDFAIAPAAVSPFILYV